MFFELSEIWSGLFIPDPDPDFLTILVPDPGVKKAPDPGSGSATLIFPGDKFELRIKPLFFQANSSWTPLCAVNFSAPLATELCLYMGYSASRNFSLVRPNRTVLATSLQQSSLPEVSSSFSNHTISRTNTVCFSLSEMVPVSLSCCVNSLTLGWGGGGGCQGMGWNVRQWIRKVKGTKWNRKKKFSAHWM